MLFKESPIGKVPAHWVVDSFKDTVFFQEGPGLRRWQFTEFGMKVLNVTNIIGDGLIDMSITNRYISIKEFDKTYSHFAIQSGDIVIASSGNTIGKIGRIYNDQLPAIVNTSTIRFNNTLKPDLINQDYLYAYLSSRVFYDQLISYSTGSAQPNVGPTHIAKMYLPIPPIHEQKMIGKVSADIEKKISTNRGKNQVLEKIAEAIFKSWFVDFEPTRAKIAAKLKGQDPEHAAMTAISGKSVAELGKMDAVQLAKLKTAAALFPDLLVESELGEVPEGWEIHALSEHINIKHGFAFKGEFFSEEPTEDILLTPGNVKIGGGFKFDKLKYYRGPIPEEYILKRNDLLVTMTDLSKQSDTLGYPALVSEVANYRFLHNQRLGKVVSKNEVPKKYFFYFLMKSHRYRGEIVGGATGTTVKHTAPKKILAFKHPFQGRLEYIFDDLAGSIHANIEQNLNNSDTLNSLRESLLPKLLSGELAPTKT